uniref:Chromoplast-specific lycopene beta-cyclase 2 n=1 Tax=Bixa orellana TaxID=66672 RepID=A0A9Y0ZFX3_BIXOR|nr:chromoplast-specific lycopene beta-cyclase 2 [Bixa orellana]
MGTLVKLCSPAFTTRNKFFGSPSVTTPFTSAKTQIKKTSRKTHQKVRVSKFGNFLELKPESQREFLDYDLPLFDPSHERPRFDVIVIGTGPAGLRLAEQVSGRGIKVCCVDPSPLSMWSNNYGVWVDEFKSLGLDDCLDKTWPMTTVHIDDKKTKYLDRPYCRVSRKKLKSRLMESCTSNGVKFHKAKVWKVRHEEFESIIECDDGSEFKASLIVDASGFASPFIKYDKPRNDGYQLAHGILAEVESHPFDLDKMVLMDWRDSHLANEPDLRERNAKLPTFLYVMPFDSNLVFLEETSLVGRPVLPYMEVKQRMVARLRHLGIIVKRVIEEEKCLIPMGGPLPKLPQNVLAMGGNSGLVHPSTGYTVYRTMAMAPVVADAIAECLGSTRMMRGSLLHRRVWNGLWPMERRVERQLYCFGMETLLNFDLAGTRRFMDEFFQLDPYQWKGFLSQSLSTPEIVALLSTMFIKASVPCKIDLATKCPLPMARTLGKIALDAI